MHSGKVVESHGIKSVDQSSHSNADGYFSLIDEGRPLGEYKLAYDSMADTSVDAADLAHNLCYFPKMSGRNKKPIGQRYLVIGRVVLVFIALALLTFSVFAADNRTCYEPQKALDGEDRNRYVNNILYGGHLEGNKVVFRLDDVSTERSSLLAVQKIMDLFNESDTPLDVGVIPHEMGLDSYKISFMKPYIQGGLIGLSIHGYGHIVNEFDTRHSKRTKKELSDGLNASIISMEKYFGKRPLSFSVPYDVFDEAGFDAVRDAGLKIFSSQKMSEDHPSIESVDFLGRFDPSHGMYRIPAVISVSLWDPHSQSYDGMLPIDVFWNNINGSFNDWGFAVVTIEPQSFINRDGSLKKDQIDILSEMIILSKERGTPTTFEKLYWENLAVSRGSVRK